MTKPQQVAAPITAATTVVSKPPDKPSATGRRRSLWGRRRSSASASTCSSHSGSSGPAGPLHSTADKRSLLRRLSLKGLSRRRSTGSDHHTHLASNRAREMEEITERLEVSSFTRRDSNEPPAHIQHLDQRGLRELDAGQLELALNTWEEALALLKEPPQDTVITTKLQCQLISLYLQLHGQQAQVSHYEAAKELISQLNTELVLQEPCCWWTPSDALLQILMDMGLWDLALSVANRLEDQKASLTVARLHLEVALQQHPQTLVLSHLSECHQLLLSLSSTLSCSVIEIQQDYKERLSTAWRDLAEAYVAQGDAAELAVACAQSRFLLLAGPQEFAMAHYDLALQIYCPLGRYEAALEEVDKGLHALEKVRCGKRLEEEDVTTTTLALKLFHCKADILCRMDRWKDSLQEYERVVEGYLVSPHHGPADAANVLYIMGKVCTHAKQYTAALTYLDRELQMTRKIVGLHHLAVSKILHELAKVAEVGLNDYPRAIQYYQEALLVESKVVQSCRQSLVEQQAPRSPKPQPACSKGTFYCHKKMQVSDAPACSTDKPSSPSTASSTNKQNQVQSQILMQDAKTQIAETKRCLGKLHFKMGDFDKALRTTLAVE